MTNIPIPLYPGDTIGLEGRPPLAWGTRYLFKVSTDLVHFVKVDGYTEPHEDVRILHSISKLPFGASGLRAGMLSEFEGLGCVVFRHRRSMVYVDCKGLTKRPYLTEGSESCDLLVEQHGSAQYDYPLILRLGVEAVLKALVKRRRIRPEELHYTKDHLVICTEAAVVGWEHDPIVPPGVVPIPNSIVTSEALKKMWEGEL